MEDVRAFKTIGPAGESVEGINGRASAIECFLVFSSRLAAVTLPQ